MTQLQLPITEGVASKIERIMARCNGVVKTGSAYFDEFNEKQARVVEGLGLRKIRHSVELADTPETRGMIHKVRHLVEVVGD